MPFPENEKEEGSEGRMYDEGLLTLPKNVI